MMVSWLTLSGNVGYAQERCATVPYQQRLSEKFQLPENEWQFEQWLHTKKVQRNAKRNHRIQSTYQIPVVIHIIHKGEAIGTGTNISNEQILSQLTVLNNDYQRLNADTVNTPTDFRAVAGSFNIEFVLAKQTPDGLPTSAIIRKAGTRTTWNPDLHDAELKALSYWPAEDYLNIWVCDLSGDYLGYAQFPVSNLPGLESYQSGLRTTDGVVFDYKAFGTNDVNPLFNLNAKYNKGRTATHEIGHFFGLRHTWGDNSLCTGTDYVDDTPNQKAATRTCPSTHPLSDDCTSAKMYQNFLDYTDDACMNLFTVGQVDRMTTILETAPRRASLLTSKALQEPELLDYDVAVTELLNIPIVSCASNVTPRVNITNTGKNTLHSITLRYQLDQHPPITRTFTDLEVASGDVITLSLDAFDVTEGKHQLYVIAEEPNGVVDVFEDNNDRILHFEVHSATEEIPLRKTFTNNEPLGNWTIINPTGGMNWAYHTIEDKPALRFNAYNNIQQGDESWLVSPILDMSQTTSPMVVFDLSYAYRQGADDIFKVMVFSACGSVLEEILFEEAGVTMANGRSSSIPWNPVLDSHWTTYTLSLRDYISTPNIRLAFIAKNHQGNNIYIRNVEFFVSEDKPQISTKYFSIYPNPTTEDFLKITLNLPDKQLAFVEVYNSFGQQVADLKIEHALNQTIHIDLPQAPSGIYYARVRTSSFTSRFQKVVIAR
jgi:hypothetical protein